MGSRNELRTMTMDISSIKYLGDRFGTIPNETLKNGKLNDYRKELYW